MENTITWHKSCASSWSRYAFIGQFKIVKLTMGGYLVHRCDRTNMPVDVGRYVETEAEALALTRQP